MKKYEKILVQKRLHNLHRLGKASTKLEILAKAQQQISFFKNKTGREMQAELEQANIIQ